MHACIFLSACNLPLHSLYIIRPNTFSTQVAILDSCLTLYVALDLPSSFACFFVPIDHYPTNTHSRPTFIIYSLVNIIAHTLRTSEATVHTAGKVIKTFPFFFSFLTVIIIMTRAHIVSEEVIMYTLFAFLAHLHSVAFITGSEAVLCCGWCNITQPFSTHSHSQRACVSGSWELKGWLFLLLLHSF